MVLRSSSFGRQCWKFCKAVQNLPVLRKALSAVNDNYLSVQAGHPGDLYRVASYHSCRTDGDGSGKAHSRSQARPSTTTRLDALVRFAHIAAGNTFTTTELYPHVVGALGWSAQVYACLAALRPLGDKPQLIEGVKFWSRCGDSRLHAADRQLVQAAFLTAASTLARF